MSWLEGNKLSVHAPQQIYKVNAVFLQRKYDIWTGGPQTAGSLLEDRTVCHISVNKALFF